jgi:hypothetical protein
MSTTTRTRSTKKYKALVAAGLDDATALKILGEPVAPQPNPLAQLLAAGFDEAEAAAILSQHQGEATEPPAPVLTRKQAAEALVAEQGLTFTKGRVYVTADIIEAAVRVRKTGSPEVVRSSGVGRTAAVLIAKEDSGDVSIQNLARPA